VSASARLRAQATSQASVSLAPDGSSLLGATGLPDLRYVPSQVLVRFRTGAPVAVLPGSGRARALAANLNLHLVDTPPGLSVAETARRYRTNPNVLYAEPDYLVTALATPTDPLWAQQWDMTKISAPTAWDSQTDASDLIVAVIDTGIDYTHPDLQGNLWVNPADGVSHGYTCMGGACTVGGLDDHGHGTHVAGAIGARANNGEGIAGINWQVKLASFKFLGSGGSGSISDAILSFQKIKDLKNLGNNFRLTNNSWGGGGYSQALQDAMAELETLGIVNVCAAGNSGVNADISPMYPAAYDNRGIISVLASDSSDFGAGFTNYGLATVDLAAPGVNTLSSVPIGSCSLCDASHYKLLSGTSMASPHVAGVLAAMIHRNQALTAHQARDVVLDQASYDPLSEARAQSTSTGGRLNFYKAITNPKLTSPGVLNNFPTLTVGANVFASAGSLVTLSATASDVDGDALRMSWAKSSASLWLFGSMLNSLFPNPSGNPFSFTAPSLARAASVPYAASVADNRGGGATGSQIVTVSPLASPGSPPVGTLSLSATDAPVGSTITINFPVTDPDGSGTPLWDLWSSGLNGASGTCCYSGSSAARTFNTAGVYRISTQAIDRRLDLSARSTALLRIGGVAGTPPLAGAVLDKLSGPAPLTVNIDMGASNDPDGTITNYFYSCGGGGFTPGSTSPQGSCSYTNPGTYWLLLQVRDNTGLMDLLSAYVVVTPPGGGGGDTTPPTVNLTSPANGASVSGTVAVSATADDLSGVSKVEFYRDSGVLIGTDLSPSGTTYSVDWNTAGLPGAHTLYARATDTAGNTATSGSVSVTVSATPPSVSIASPANGAQVTRKSTVTITASPSAGSYPVSRVEFFVGSNLSCTDTTSPYTCAWKVPAAAGKTYQLKATVYDTGGQSATSPTVTVTSK
jgi:subtilisin family serine protease